MSTQGGAELCCQQNVIAWREPADGRDAAPGSVEGMRHSTPAAYDAIADWYATEFLAAQAHTDPIGVTAAVTALLGPAPDGSPGGPTCLEIGCGTGVHAATVRALGWTPVGVDLS